MPNITDDELMSLKSKVPEYEMRLHDLGCDVQNPSEDSDVDRFRTLAVERDLAKSLLESQAVHQTKVIEEAVQFYFAMSTMLDSFGKRLRKLTEQVELKSANETD